MPETITLNALDLSGETLTMFLRRADGTLLNTGGDAMTEAGATGVFTATLAEARTGLGPLAVRACAGAETAANLLYDGFLVEGSAVIDSTVAAVLDSATAAKITAIDTFATRMTTGLVVDGAFFQFTANMLELAPAGGGGGGGGDATLAKQNEILTRLSEVTISVTGYAQLDANQVLQLKRGHTATLTFTSDTSNLVSDLSAATTKVFFGVKDAAGRSWLSIEGTKLVNTGLQSVQFVITAALAAAMINGEHFFDVVAVYGYDADTTPKYTSLQPFATGRAKVTNLYVDI